VTVARSMDARCPAGDCAAIAERGKLHDDLCDLGEDISPNRAWRLARLAGIRGSAVALLLNPRRRALDAILCP
jgi:hypothetical protein